MNAIEQAIKEAVEKGGYGIVAVGTLSIPATQEQVLLDPLFWQALGKARGWNNHNPIHDTRDISKEPWKIMWHRLIDHLAEGKSTEDYFASLILK